MALAKDTAAPEPTNGQATNRSAVKTNGYATNGKANGYASTTNGSTNGKVNGVRREPSEEASVATVGEESGLRRSTRRVKTRAT
jgi:hypothetical protein